MLILHIWPFYAFCLNENLNLRREKRWSRSRSRWHILKHFPKSMLDPCTWLRIMNKEFCKSLFLWSTTNMPGPAMSPFMWENWCRKNNKYDFRRTAAHQLLLHSVWQPFSKRIVKCWKFQNCRWILSRSESWHNWCLFLTGFDDSCISSNFLNSPPAKEINQVSPLNFYEFKLSTFAIGNQEGETYKKKKTFEEVGGAYLRKDFGPPKYHNSKRVKLSNVILIEDQMQCAKT